MKRFLAIVVLSVFLITYLLPVTTLVRADVVIGDNDEVIVNENAYILGRKLALMESIPNLLNNGVTELTISNVEDLDEYLDDLWDELGNAVDYLTSGEWADDISLQLRNEALENITNYINYVGDRENIFANLLQNPTTQLLKEYVIGNNLPKTEYHPNYNTLNTFKKLSALNKRDEPLPNPDPDYVTLINIANNNQAYGFFWGNIPSSFRNGSRNAYLIPNPSNNFSWFCSGESNFEIITYDSNGLRVTRSTLRPANTILTLNINQVGNSYQGNISGITSQDFCWDMPYSTKLYYYYASNLYYSSLNNYSSCTPQGGYSQQNTNGISNKVCSYTGTLYEVMSYFCNRFRNINIYVNGDAWSIVNYNPPLYPTLDIDGVLQLYGNDNPPQYDIQNGTEIDYDILYDTIYNAIINALPIDQQDITYYDSHDNIYSPTIINNYGSDSDGENDWIESILDYAIVPEFDTALVAPISEPIANGTVIMLTGVSVIPDDILFVLGAAFVLILFVCIINRMIE